MRTIRGSASLLPEVAGSQLDLSPFSRSCPPLEVAGRVTSSIHQLKERNLRGVPLDISESILGCILRLMAYKFVSSLDSGNIASVLKVFAIFLGLLVAANLQAILSLAARRRLYSHGTARLCDSTWNVGVLQGATNPRRLLRDFRACLAFLLALLVICLEVLTVLQTKESKSCSFGESSTWNIQKSSQKYFSPTPEMEGTSSSYLATIYVSRARDKAKDVDLRLGIPVFTDVFEDSVISGKAVTQLGEGNYSERYTAPVVEVFETKNVVSVYDGAPVSVLEYLSGKDTYRDESCLFSLEQGGLLHYFPSNPEYRDYAKNKSALLTASKGYVGITPCVTNLVVRVCDYVGGRQEMTAIAVKFEVQCKVHVIFREGRRTDSHSIAALLLKVENVDTSSIRRAILASLIAQNSANTVPCKGYIAAPKECTQIGWVSMGAVLLLIALFVITSFVRLWLKIASREAANFNGSPQMLAETLFNHFEGPERRAFAVPGKSKKRELLLGPRLHKEDIHMSVVNSVNDPDSYRLVWTRGPLTEGATPAAQISSKAIVSHSVQAEDEEEVSLVY